MKRIVQVFVLLFFAAGILNNVHAQNQVRGVIRELNGTVEIKHAGQAVFSTANIGDELFQDSIISAAFRSSALIEIGSTVIAVQALTRLSLRELSTSAREETVNVNLQAGRVRVDVNPPAGTRANMTISGPSATASVRGTRLHFDGRNIHVPRGTVDFRGSRGQQVTVRDGSSSRIDNRGRPESPRYTGAEGGRQNDFDDGLVPESPVGTDSASGLGQLGTTGGEVPFVGHDFGVDILYP